jgi:2-polyprenyl-3-methyl-5-hydroxy-6-metoxy-1,4-benzoquinol methylase
MPSPRPYYHEFAWAYDLLQPAPVASHVDFIQATLHVNGITNGAHILDAGCGTGRYAVELAKRGFRVSGVDRSPDLIAVARSRELIAADRLHFVVADLLEVLFAHPFDAILCRGVLNDFVADDSRELIFRRLGLWLRPAGILIFDVREWVRTMARYTKDSSHFKELEIPNGRLQFRSETALVRESHQLRISERFEIEQHDVRALSQNEFTMRCWTSDEIARYLAASALDQLSTSATYGESGRAWSDRLVVIARKRTAAPNYPDTTFC